MKSIICFPRLANKSKGFYQFLSSYIFTVLVLICIISIEVFFSFVRILDNKAIKDKVLIISQTANRMDELIREINEKSASIQNNSTLNYYMLTYNLNEYNNINDILRTYNSGSTYVEDIAIYPDFSTGSMVFSTQGFYLSDYYFGNVLMREGWNGKDIVSFIRGLGNPTIQPVMMHMQASRYLSFILPVPTFSTQPRGVIIFFSSVDKIESIFSEMRRSLGSCSFAITTHDKEILYESSDMENNSFKALVDKVGLYTKSEQIQQVDTGKGKYLTVIIKSKYYDWYYQYFTPYKVYMGSSSRYKLIYVLLLASMFLAGIFVAVIVADRNYRPISKLVRLISTDEFLKSDGTNYRNELEYIHEILRRALSEKQELMTKIKSNVTILKEQVLLDLLSGRYEKAGKLKDVFDTIGLDINAKYFRVLVFLIDDYAEFSKTYEKPWDSLMLFSIINVLEELSLSVGRGYGIELLDGRGVALLLNMQERDEMRDICIFESILNKASGFFKEYYAFTMTAGISDVCDDVRKLGEAFKQAQEAAHYRLAAGKSTAILYDTIPHDKYRHWKCPAEKKNALYLAIFQGKKEQVPKLIHNIIEDILEQHLCLEAMEYTCRVLLQMILELVEQIGREYGENFEAQVKAAISGKWETVQELEDILKELCLEICEMIDTEDDNSDVVVKNRIIRYVNENYRDSNMSLDSIAKCIGLSPSYATAVFKKLTGKTIMKYVDQVRMAQAKRLLVETDMINRDIIMEVGYVDEANFLRKFKHIEGVTPMQYRSMNRSM